MQYDWLNHVRILFKFFFCVEDSETSLGSFFYEGRKHQKFRLMPRPTDIEKPFLVALLCLFRIM